MKMTGSNPDHDLIREYLLGRLDDNETTETKMSEEILLDEELAEVAESVEDEILEEYVEETLGPADRKSVEEYFLRPPERQQKLRFMRILAQQLASKPVPVVHDRAINTSEAKREPRSSHGRSERVVWWRIPWVYGQIAAVIVLGVSAASYVTLTQHKQAALEHDLDREKAHSASLAKQATQLQPPLVALSLVASRPRGAGTNEEIPRLEIKASTERIVVEIAVEHPRPGAYQVRLEARGSEEPIWRGTLLPIISEDGDARLVFDLPAKGLNSGIYSIAVSEPPNGGAFKYYDFNLTAPR